MRLMGYKLLGFVVWQGTKLLLRHRLSGARTKLAIGGGVGAAVAAGVLVAARQATSE